MNRERYEEAPDLQRALDVAWRSSPASSIGTWKSPVLLIHGDDDRNVAFQQTTGLVQLLRDPTVTLLVLALLAALAIFAVTRTTWRPVAPLRLAHRRSWGQTLSAASRMYVSQARVFLGIGIVLIPLGIVISLLQGLITAGFGLVGVEATGESAGGLVLIVVAVGTTLTLLAFGIVQAATARALVEIDRGKPIGPIQAYRLALEKIAPLLAGLAIAVAAWFALSTTVFLIPVAIWLVVRWILLAQAVELEDRSGLGGLRRSSELVRHRWIKVATLVGVAALLALAAGPLLGALLILVTDAPLALLNVVAGLVYALSMPFVALMTSYVYFDALVRSELEPEEMNGSGTPVSGISPSTAKKLSVAWHRISEVIPAASSFE
jgi:hypothetical protein